MVDYLKPILILGGIWLFSFLLGSGIIHSIHLSSEPGTAETLITIVVFFTLSYVSTHGVKNTIFPSFVFVIFCGMAAKPLLLPLTSSNEATTIIVTLCAAMILFGGGLETPLKNFWKLFGKIVMLALPGVLLTGWLISWLIHGFSSMLNLGISLTTAILLGAILASTDPAAIIPLFQGMKFRKRDVKDIVVSESAVNDVVGALLTFFFLGIYLTGRSFDAINPAYVSLFSYDSVLSIFKQSLVGFLSGFLAFLLLHAFKKQQESNHEDHGANHAFFMLVPFMAFVGALMFGGSGFLAVFVAGLFFHMTDHMHTFERFFNHTIDGFFKPVIFILLGAMVDIDKLLDYAGIGVLVAFAFMLVVRPMMVFLMLSPYLVRGSISVRELAFISCVRETGAIPAVLLTATVSSGIININGLLEIGMWVVLLTLLIQPVITPWIARKLGIVE